MKRTLLIIFIYFILIQNLAIALENKILFKVENEIITTVDIKNEINYLKIFNQQINNLEENQIYEIAKNSVIREKIKSITILKLIKEFQINDEYLKKLVENNYLKDKFNSLKEFKTFLKAKDIKYSYLSNKLVINSHWNQLIYEKYGSKVKINRVKIEEEILANKNFLNQLFLSEIVFDLEEKETLNNKFDLIKKSINQIGFKNAALTFSISESASEGGEIGWVSENSLNKIILKQVNKIKIGEYTNPIVVPGGFIIIKLEDIKKKKIEVDVKKEIEKVVMYKTNQQLNTFSNIYLKKIIKDYEIEKL